MIAIELTAYALLGFLFWGLLEYAIHGLLSHRWTTFATPLHWGHHREPRAVFTSPIAVLPSAALLYGLLALLLGASHGSAFFAGTLAGFVRYEHMHWRFHFRSPRNDRERLLREHHLAHHFRNPRAYHGVTTRLWDRIFGTLPASRHEDYAYVANWASLEGEGNLVEIWNPRTALAALQRPSAQAPEGPEQQAAGEPLKKTQRKRPTVARSEP